MQLNKIFMKNMVIFDLFRQLTKGDGSPDLPIFMQHDNFAKAKRWADDIERCGNLELYFKRMCKGAI